jgi:hypothetical protein
MAHSGKEAPQKGALHFTSRTQLLVKLGESLKAEIRRAGGD